MPIRSLMFAVLLALGCQGQFVEPGSVGSEGAETQPPPVDLRDPPDAAVCLLPEQRLWRLTTSQYRRTVAALVEGVANPGAELAALTSTDTRFTNNADVMTMTLPRVEALFSSATRIVAEAEEETFDGCLAEASPDAACISSFVARFGERAFRRPLEVEEQARYVAFFESEAAIDGTEIALEQLVRVFLMSPHFLYRFEIGNLASAEAEVDLTGYERASALSYFLLDGPPDEELLAAAAAGELASAEQLRAQASRLLSDSDRAAGVHAYFDELLHPEDIVEVNKDEERFPDFGSSIAEAMAEETRAFVRHVLWEDDARFATLLEANYTVVNEELAEFYGYARPDGNGFGRVTLEGESRAGLLGQGSFLATHATFTESSVIERGHFIREEILCGTIPPPPPEVSDNFPTREEGETQRAFLEERHSAGSSCAGCHRLMDDLGFGLEHFDAVGRYRTEDVGQPIDASGEVVEIDVDEPTFDGAVELAAVLAEAPEAEQCMIKHLQEYASGRAVSAADSCTLFDLNEAFAASDGSILDLVVTIVASDAFARRRVGGAQ
ncbi:MAG: DUF1592 domain-containing protein [Myxococcota bacterium]